MDRRIEWPDDPHPNPSPGGEGLKRLLAYANFSGN